MTVAVAGVLVAAGTAWAVTAYLDSPQPEPAETAGATPSPTTVASAVDACAAGNSVTAESLVTLQMEADESVEAAAEVATAYLRFVGHGPAYPDADYEVALGAVLSSELFTQAVDEGLPASQPWASETRDFLIYGSRYYIESASSDSVVISFALENGLNEQPVLGDQGEPTYFIPQITMRHSSERGWVVVGSEQGRSLEDLLTIGEPFGWSCS
ncbi:hypothetical protein [Agromyces sp. Soil535]|uniref:hypothetical protein n=1 Tax=Agromyces sp. Soil535 TaxID=1736390 RepID=UPI0012E3C01E|nr:hypothetical protein [Agromyces sp. Soil535]